MCSPLTSFAGLIYPESDDEESIEPAFDIPLPTNESLTQWRTFVSTCYHHPNLMSHPDASCLRDLFEKLGCQIRCDSINILIPLDSQKQPSQYIRPPFPDDHFPEPVLFGSVEDYEIVPHINICILRKYTFSDSLKLSMSGMVNYVLFYPEVLLSEYCIFIKDFLIKFGVDENNIEDVIKETHKRRGEGIYPASTLLPELPCTAPTNNDSQSSSNHVVLRKSSRIQELPAVDFAVISTGKARRSRFLNGKLIHTQQYETKVEEPAKRINITSKFQDSSVGKSTNIEFDPSKTPRRRISEDEKPFGCPVCGIRFVYKSNCNNHLRMKHPKLKLAPPKRVRKIRSEDYVSPYFCPVCVYKGFSSRSNAAIHIGKFHPTSNVVPIPADQHKIIRSRVR